MRVALDLVRAREVPARDVEDDAFGDDRDAVATALAEPLDDGAGQRVDDRLQPDAAC